MRKPKIPGQVEAILRQDSCRQVLADIEAMAEDIETIVVIVRLASGQIRIRYQATSQPEVIGLTELATSVILTRLTEAGGIEDGNQS